jgi:hypothetical protein
VATAAARGTCSAEVAGVVAGASFAMSGIAGKCSMYHIIIVGIRSSGKEVMPNLCKSMLVVSNRWAGWSRPDGQAGVLEDGRAGPGRAGLDRRSFAKHECDERT